MAGVVGGTFQSLAPGEDTRFLLASLVVVIVGGMGSIPGAALGAVIVGLAEQLGLGLYPVLCDRADLPHHGARAGRAAAGPAGEALAMALADTPAPRAGAAAAAARLSGRRIAPGRRARRRRAVCLPLVANEFSWSQIFAWSLILGIIALSLMFLAGYGGMVSLVQITLAGLRRLHVRDLRRHRHASVSLGWPWWLATPIAHRARDCCSARSAARSRCAPRASTRS